MRRAIVLFCALGGLVAHAAVSGGHVERVEAVVDARGDAEHLPGTDEKSAGGEVRSFIRREAHSKRQDEGGRVSEDPGDDEDGHEEVQEQNASLSEGVELLEEEQLAQQREFDALNITVNTALTGNVPFINTWRNYGGGWSPVTYAVRGGVCYLQGLARGYRWSSIARLPSNCRPRKRLIFSCNNHQSNARCDVATNGVISWHAGGHRHHWLSLSGIKFNTAAVAEIPMQMLNGWRAYGGGWGVPSFSVNKGYCVVSGLGYSAQNKWGVIGTLPQDCWPRKRLVFQVNNHQYTSRVDVHYNGEVTWVGGGKSHRWVSLAGISFPVTSYGQGSVHYHPSYKWHDFDYGSVHAMWNWGGLTYTAANGICMLEGLASQGATSQKRVHYAGRPIAILPTECRPKRRYIYSGSRHDFASRIDVNTNGYITLHTNIGTHNWVSFSGVAFEIDIKSFKGPRGDKGALGAQGPRGHKGHKGSKGIVGNKGAQGNVGFQGADGIPGINGSDGERGEHGVLGEDGELGGPGDDGAAGDDGPAGYMGVAAPQPEAVDCHWLDWFAWSDCTVTCARGSMSRHRLLKTAPSNGGADCEGGHIERKECMMAECDQAAARSNASQEEAPNMEEPVDSAVGGDQQDENVSDPGNMSEPVLPVMPELLQLGDATTTTTLKAWAYRVESVSALTTMAITLAAALGITS